MCVYNANSLVIAKMNVGKISVGESTFLLDRVWFLVASENKYSCDHLRLKSKCYAHGYIHMHIYSYILVLCMYARVCVFLTQRAGQ